MAVMPHILAEYDGKWQSNLGRAQLLGKIADHPKQTNRLLKDIIPVLSGLMWDTKPQVKETSIASMNKCCGTVSNKDIIGSVPAMVKCIEEPQLVPETVHKLAGIVFVQEIEASALAIMGPLLKRGMDDPATATKRNCARIIENMSKLVDDPFEVEPFVPLLLPQLNRAKEEVADPECRTVCEKAHEQLDQTSKRPAVWQRIEREKVLNSLKDIAGKGAEETVLAYVAALAHSMLDMKILGANEWKATLSGHLGLVLAPGQVEGAITKFLEVCAKDVKIEEEKEEADDAEQLCDCQFSLAYGNKVLLNQTMLKLKRGYRYGLCGKNDSGKTSLMRAIADGQLEEQGFPSSKDLRTMFVETDVQGEAKDGSGRLLSECSVLEFVSKHAGLDKYGVTEADCREKLLSVGFAEDDSTMAPASLTKQVGRLSGGWRMKCALTRAMLMKADILLLDEPTNHLDRDAIDWLTAHLLSLKGVTMAVVSHDYDFVDAVCSDVTHYDNGGELGKPCKFVYYPMRFHQFQILKPEVAAGLPQADKGVASTADVLAANRTPSEVSEASERSADDSLSKSMETMSVTSDSERSDMSASLSKIDEMIAQGLVLPMRFPDPGKPEGIRTFRKPIMTLKNVNFKYPTSEKYILEKVTSTLTLGSRAVIVGGNGSGKSTCLKLLIGDLEPEEGSGEVWKHHNLRLAYVAQQSLHHLEDYLTQTPIHYIQERFRQGLDAEVSKLKTLEINDEDREEIKKAGSVNEILGRQQRGRALWYELQLTGRMKDDTKWVPLSELEGASYKPYVKKLIKNYDMKAQALESGMAVRPVTAAEILAHLADFGVDSQLAHGKIRQMSGGQRQRLVISAAFWSKPHVIALDEPTNYLDNDSVAALTKALKDFKGAVLCVSENEAFVNEISNEKWVVENGAVTMVQLRDAKAR
uniref:ABC transporter domain-containing protein n=1 Tax=Haptolina brevifila TaxID=156173 RepID=A0A7S2G4P2_9EUKA